MWTLFLLACAPQPLADTDTDTDTDTDPAPVTVERRLRCNYTDGEGLTLADGQVGPRDEADLQCSLGRYITLSAPGGLCELGGFDALASVPGDCPTADGWTPHLLCAVNSGSAEPACAGVGLVVHPQAGDETYRVRVLVDELVVDGDYLAGIKLEYAR